jgi:hypothetical protein
MDIGLFLELPMAPRGDIGGFREGPDTTPEWPYWLVLERLRLSEEAISGGISHPQGDIALFWDDIWPTLVATGVQL